MFGFFVALSNQSMLLPLPLLLLMLMLLLLPPSLPLLATPLNDQSPGNSINKCR